MNKNKWLVPVLCIGIVLCLAVTMWALFFRDGGKPIAPDPGTYRGIQSP